MKKLLDQIVKFGIVGVICFFIDFGVYNLFNFVFDILGFPDWFYLVSQGLAFIVSVTANYILSFKFVFERREDISRKHEFVVFVVLSAIGLVINEVAIYVGVDLIYKHWMWLRSWMSYDFAKNVFFKCFATGVVMVYNFISRKMVLEKK